MDFFERQEQARRNTRWLAGFFLMAILLMTLAIYLVFLLLFHYGEYEPAWGWFWHADLFGAVAFATLLVVAIGSLYKTLALRQGGAAVAQRLGGVLVPANSPDPDHRRLLNVVEEMALASGMPVPEVYVLPDEKGINAFAAGHAPQDAVVAVTEGGMKLLSRDELQGVVAHEFSHILNGDMRLNLRLIGLINGILCIAIIGRVLLRSSSRRYYVSGARNRKSSNPLPMIGLALMVIGAIGVFFGRLIKSAISRQREFLADAAAVQFTRNPPGLAGALKKIGGLVYGSRLEAANAEEASHLFFSNGLSESWLQWMATHPPLLLRIRLLEPSFDGHFPKVDFAAAPEARSVPPPIPRSPEPPRLVQPQAARPVEAVPISPGEVIARVGAPSAQHLEYAAALRTALPGALVEAAREPMSAVALIYGLLLSAGPAIRTAQLDQLKSQVEPGLMQELARLLAEIDRLSAGSKLPLVLLSMPALGRLSPGQYQRFCQSIRALIECDRQIDLFEFTLQKMVVRRLRPRFEGGQPAVVRFGSLKPLLPDCAVLLSALAWVGQSDPAQAQRAFAEGVARLPDGGQLTLLELGRCGLAQVDAALERLAQAVPSIKKMVLESCAYAVAADGLIQCPEAELLRAIADTLDCPLPAFIEGV